jgi:hypothetical protein
VDLVRSEAKFDDGGQSVAFRATETDVVTVESRHEAFSVNWTARTGSSDFVRQCKDYLDLTEASSVIYSYEAKRYLRIPGKELLHTSNLGDIGFMRFDLPSSVAIAWQHDNINDSNTVGCAMSELDFSFIATLFENTASNALTPLAKELDDVLGFLRYSYKER